MIGRKRVWSLLSGVLGLVVAMMWTVPGWAGSVKGTVVFNGDAPRLPTLRMDADPACQAKHSGPVTAPLLVLGSGNTVANVFVQIRNAPKGSFPPPKEPVIVDQVDCLYQPRVAGVMVGQQLLFRNSDKLMHNVRGEPEENRAFNIGMPAVIPEADQRFNKPEPLFPVKCDIHPWMNAFIAVMEHPFFAVTGEDGRFLIENLPAGEYEIEVWHERLGTITKRVTVEAEGTATVNLALNVPSR